MELATTVVITLSVVVVLLQIWTIASLLSLKKRVNGLAEEKSAPVSNTERHEKRDQDFRRNRRPPEQRPMNRPPVVASAAAADPVEKSLRDINLKLKNAERDQESARKKIQDNFQGEPRRDGENTRRGGGRDNRGDRGGRGDRGPRDHRRDGNRDNRDNRRSGWQDRDQQPRRDFQPRTPATETPEEPTFEVPQTNEPLQQQSQPIAPSQVAGEIRKETPDFAVADAGMTDENLQHGRKIMVKRRTLKEEEEGQAAAGGSAAGESSSGNSSESEAVKRPEQDSGNSAGSSEIRFGRR